MKEILLNQKSVVLWFTGFSGAGKTTLAQALEKELGRRGYLCRLFDADAVRKGVNRDLGFSDEDRSENIRRIAEVSKLLKDSGIIILAAFISPLEKMRKMAKEIIGADDFIEVFVNTPISLCEKRDTKGLYKKAEEGLINNFTGVSAPYEAPSNPDLTIDTSIQTVEESLSEILEYVIPRITSS